MSFSISIGDVIMLSKMSYRIGKLLVADRKTAPAELVDVENLISSLGEGLGLLASQNAAEGDNDTLEPNISRVVKNCQPTLRHLEKITRKYAIISSQPPPLEEQSGGSFWRRNWRKIQWTTEGGDVAKLKASLTAHVACIHLAIAANNNSKLDEIYQWFIKNLRERANFSNRATSPEATGMVVSPVPNVETPQCTFTLSRQSIGSSNKTLVCPWASLKALPLEYTREELGTFSSSLSQIPGFACLCTSPSRSCSDLRFLRFADFSYPYRVVNKSHNLEWQIFVHSSRDASPLRLYITNLALSDLPRFYESIRMVFPTLRTPTGLLDHDEHAQAGSYTAPKQEERLVRFAEAPELSSASADTLAIDLVVNSSTFRLPRLEHTQLIQRMPVFDDDSVSDWNTHSERIRPRAAELTFTCENNSSFSVALTKDTRIARGSHIRMIEISDCECTSNSDEDTPTSTVILCDSIICEMRTSAAASSFLDNVKVMQQELFIQHLQNPSHDEEIALQCSSGNLIIQGCVLQESQILMLRHRHSRKYRLILLNKSQTSSVTIELPGNTLLAITGAEATEEATSVYNDERYPAWFVIIGEENTALFQQRVSMGDILSTGV